MRRRPFLFLPSVIPASVLMPPCAEMALLGRVRGTRIGRNRKDCGLKMRERPAFDFVPEPSPVAHAWTSRRVQSALRAIVGWYPAAAADRLKSFLDPRIDQRRSTAGPQLPLW